MVVGRRNYSAAPADEWKEHLFASRGTRMRFDKKVPHSVVQKLTFLRAAASMPLKFVSPGKLYRQALRGVAELDPRSASLLDTLLPPLRSIAINEEKRENKETDTQRKVGGGFGSQEMNRKVERAAIRFVKKHYESRGWRVQSVEPENRGYDLLCIKGNTQVSVEVKGVRGEELSFPITVGEISYARKNASSKIIVVTSALSKRPRVLSYSWADFDKAFELKPLAFRASSR